MNTPYRYLGKSHPSIDGRAKTLGETLYTADVQISGMLHAQLVLSREAHGRLDCIHVDEACSVPGVVTVLTAADLPVNSAPPKTRMEAVLAKETVTFAGQPVAIVIAESAAAAADGVSLVEIDCQELPPVVGLPDATPLPDQKDLQSINENEVTRGDAAASLQTSDYVVRRTYQTPFVHQGYIEPTASVAAPDPSGSGVTVYSSCQGQFDVRTQLATILELPLNAIRIVPMPIGGGFGGKKGLADPLAAAAALHLGRPVKLVLDRSSDLATTTPSPAMRIKMELGANRSGELTALRAELWLNNGAFPIGMAAFVANQLSGCYRLPHLHLRWHDVCTNMHTGGGYRAPGAPQTTFAIETAIDTLANRLSIDPLEFRARNVAHTGDPQPNGTPWPPGAQNACLDAVRTHPLWLSKDTSSDQGLIGTGIAFAGWIPIVDPCAVYCRVDPDGTVEVVLGAIDISGVFSSLVLVAAEELGIAPIHIRLHTADSASAPHGPSAGGSNITCSAADAVRSAAREVKHQILSLAADLFEAAIEDVEIEAGSVRVVGVPDQSITIAEIATTAQKADLSGTGRTGPIQASGRAATAGGSAVFVAHVARVTIDPETGHIQTTAYLSVQDVGFAMNPLLVEGQLHGGAVQSLGIGLYEAMQHDPNGQLLTGTLMDYALPKAQSVPPITVQLLQSPSHGPFGARGVGEPPILGGAAAVANAIRAATEIELTTLPLYPETVWRATRPTV